jgi:hypothetical protein
MKYLGRYNLLPEKAKSCTKGWDRVAIGNGSFVHLSEIRYKISEAPSAINHCWALSFRAVHKANKTRLE